MAFLKRYKIPLAIALGGVILGFILDRAIPEFSVVNIIVSTALFLFNIIIFRIPIWLLLAVSLMAFILFRIKRGTLDERHKFILSIISGGDIELETLALAYKERWPKTSRTKTQCAKILEKLECLRLIELGCLLGGAITVQREMFRITDKGKKHLEKIEDNVKEKAEEIFDEVYREASGLEPMNEEIESNMEDIIFILKIMANDKDKKALKSRLCNDYMNQFKDKDLAHFNYIWSVLERKGLIEQSRGTTGYGGGYGELPFYIENKGLKIYNENRKRFEK